MNQWQTIFKKKGRVFNQPHRDISRFVELLEQIGAKNVLDLGCGTGRHTIALAQKGLLVHAIDVSEEGLRQTEEWLEQEQLKARLQVGDIYTGLPYQDDFFDGVISTAVLHHNKVTEIKSLIRELERVMKPDAVLMIEVPVEKHAHETHQEIEPGTFVPLEGPEKDLPHHIFTVEELRDFFNNFQILDFHSTAISQKEITHITMFAKLKGNK